MSCEKYSGWMTGAALGELRPEREPELLAHAMECAACRDALAHAREVRNFVDRGVAALVAGELSPQFAVHLRRRIARESELQRSPWTAWAPVIASALALVVLLATMFTRRPVHNRSDPSLASAVNPVSAVPTAVSAPAAIPQGPVRTASESASKRGARSSRAAAVFPEIIVPESQLAAAAQLSAAIDSGRVDGNQLLAAQQEYGKPLEVKPIEIAPMEIPALDAATEKPANSIRF
jgi:anti-sigma factor RsiW